MKWKNYQLVQSLFYYIVQSVTIPYFTPALREEPQQRKGWFWFWKLFSLRLTFKGLSPWNRRTQESQGWLHRYSDVKDVRRATLRGNEAQTSLQSCLYHLVSGLSVHVLSTSGVWFFVPVYLLQPFNPFDYLLILTATSGFSNFFRFDTCC